MCPDVGEREESVVLEEVAIDPVGIGDHDDLGPVLQFGSPSEPTK